jgi:uncharacterized protein (DUF427 family)
MTQVRGRTRQEILAELTPSELLRFEPSPRRVRTRLGGVTVADSTRMMLMHEWKRLPVYYFPRADVRTDLLAPTDHRTESPALGTASYWTIRAGDRVAENAAWSYQTPPSEHAEVAEYVAFNWHTMDAWFEEDDEVFVHARDPYSRVDVLNSSRHVRIVVAGETLAETRRPRLLFETGLPTRYYIPKLDVRMDLLEPSDTITHCPYKGEARYWSVRIGDQLFPDLVWSYPYPIPECPKIERLLCFFNERVDAIFVDGEEQAKPQTAWS